MTNTGDRIARAGLWVFAFFVGLGAALIPLIEFGWLAAWAVFAVAYVGSYHVMKRELLTPDEPPEVAEKIEEGC